MAITLPTFLYIAAKCPLVYHQYAIILHMSVSLVSFVNTFWRVPPSIATNWRVKVYWLCLGLHHYPIDLRDRKKTESLST